MPMQALLTKKQQAEFMIANSAAMAAAHKAGEARNKASLQAAATVFTGSKWDKRERKELAGNQTKIGQAVRPRIIGSRLPRLKTKTFFLVYRIYR